MWTAALHLGTFQWALTERTTLDGCLFLSSLFPTVTVSVGSHETDCPSCKLFEFLPLHWK